MAPDLIASLVAELIGDRLSAAEVARPDWAEILTQPLPHEAAGQHKGDYRAHQDSAKRLPVGLCGR